MYSLLCDHSTVTVHSLNIMKIFQIVILALTIVSVICSENGEKRSSNGEPDIPMNRGEYFAHEDELFNDQLKGFNGQFGDKVKTKKYFPPQPKEKMQYMIIKRTREVPVGKKYTMAHSSSEMTSYHNKHPSKIAYSVAHKPKVKIVQEGSVKHIYLDMPDMYDDVSHPDSSKLSQVFDNTNQETINTPLQVNGYNSGQFKQNYYKPAVQYSNIPTNINSASAGISQAHLPIGQEFNTVSSGYRVGNNNERNPLSQGYGQQFNSGGKEFNTVSSGYTIGKDSENNPLTQGYGQKFPSGGQEFSTVSGGYQIGKSGESNPLNQGHQQQFQGGYPNGFDSNIYSAGPQAFENSEYSSPAASQFSPSYQNAYSDQQFPQFSADGKERYTYEIPDQYKYLFANNHASNQFGQLQEFTPNMAHSNNNNYVTNQFGQSQQTSSQVAYDNNNNYPASVFGQHQEISPNVGYNQQPYDLGKSTGTKRVSGFDPNLLNIMNDVLNKDQGYSATDGFKMIKSGDDKSVYLIGKPGMPLDTVPNLASYNFPKNSPSEHTQTPGQINIA